MVMRLFFILVCSLISAFAYAEFSTRLNKTHARIGEPIQLRIISSAALTDAALIPLQKDFEVFSQTINSSLIQGRERFIHDVTLYPLRAGNLIVPALLAGADRTRSLAIQIEPSPILVHAWLPPKVPMEREPTTLHLQISDDGSVTWDTPIEVDAPHTTLHLVAEKTREELQSGSTRIVHEYRWLVLPLKAGSLKIDFGMLDAHKFGQRLRFPVNAISFRVQAAPGYLPLHLPIGKPTIRLHKLPAHMVAGEPRMLTLDIYAPGLSPEGALKLLRYRTPAGLRFYAPSITPITFDGLDGLRFNLTFVPEYSAKVFPSLHLPYFDIPRQRIEVISIPSVNIEVRSLVREKIIVYAVRSAGFFLLIVLAYIVWKNFKRWKNRRTWLDSIHNAQDPATLYQVLTRAASGHSQTLGQWSKYLAIDPALLLNLEQARFGLQQPDIPFSKLKQAWGSACVKIPLAYFKISVTKLFANPTITSP